MNAACSSRVASSTCASGTDCFRQISQVLVQLNGVPGSPPSLTSALIFQTLFAQGKISCGIPPAGAEACITPADLVQFGIGITHNGPIPPLTVLFSGAPDYQNTYSEQAELGVERDLGKEFSVSLSYIHARTLHIPRARYHALLARDFGSAELVEPVYIRAPDADRMLA